MAGHHSSRRGALPLLVLFFFFFSLLLATASASGGFEQYAKRQNDLPDISSITNVVGASTTRSSSSSRSTSASATSSASSASETTADSSSTNAASSTSSTTSGTALPLPSLYGVGAPALIVPDTDGAPFMQKSALPEGTVFICVGAILGFLGACVLAWRGLVAYSLRRSVQRASSTAYAPDSKFGGHARSESAFHTTYNGSNLSLDYLSSQKTGYTGAGTSNHVRDPSSTGKSKSRRTSRVPSGAASSLFFSPTANVASNTGSATNRSSTFLPAGYYAAGASAIGGPAAAGYGRVDSMESGLDSPGVRPSTAGMGRPGSSGMSVSRQQGGERRTSRFTSPGPDRGSSLSPSNGQQQSGNRAPSAYMEDLFNEHGYGPRERF